MSGLERKIISPHFKGKKFLPVIRLRGKTRIKPVANPAGNTVSVKVLALSDAIVTWSDNCSSTKAAPDGFVSIPSSLT